MTKQEEIREVIDAYTDDDCQYHDRPCEFRGSYGYCISTDDAYKCLMKRLDELGVVIKVDRELPEKLTNNIGCMSKEQIEEFASMVLMECGYEYKMKWTTAGNIVIEPFIYIDERNIDQYPYLVKYWVLHEIAHIDTHPQDDRHGELFHRRLAGLMNRFMAGYVAVEPLINTGGTK